MLPLLALLSRPALGGPKSPWEAEPATRSEIVAEIAQKRVRLTGFLEREKLGGVLLETRASQAWITGGLYDPQPGGLRVSLLVLRDGAMFVLGDENEVARLDAEDLSGLGFEARASRWLEPPKLAAAVKDIVGSDALGSDRPHDGMRLVARELGGLRCPLTDAEVKKYRWLGAEAAEAVEDACRKVRPGMMEAEVAEMADDALGRRGIRALSTCATADKRLARWGPVAPSLERVRSYFTVEVAAERWGLVVCLARSARFGNPPPPLRRDYAAAVQVNANLEAVSRPGATAYQLFDRLVQIYTDANVGTAWDNRDVGGAVGYTARDWTVRPRVAETLAAPQAFAWHPIVNGSMVEDTILVLGDHSEPITVTATWPCVKTFVHGKAYLSPDILVLK